MYPKNINALWRNNIVYAENHIKLIFLRLLLLQKVVHVVTIVIYRVKYKPQPLAARPEGIVFKNRLGVMFR